MDALILTSAVLKMLKTTKAVEIQSAWTNGPPIGGGGGKKKAFHSNDMNKIMTARAARNNSAKNSPKYDSALSKNIQSFSLIPLYVFHCD